MSKVKPYGGGVLPATPTKPPETQSGKDHSGRATRETIESIAVAVILAFLFRAFVAEAFVIPTGSMAPTLQGRHMDVTCSKCGCPYRTGASVENEGMGEVKATTCPICRFPMELKKDRDPNQRSFNGDRILVSKFAYEVGDPKRWDVIVFKFPGNAKQNYIKRLVGLPNETLWIRHGNVYTRSAQESNAGKFRIARKPPHKLKAMLQVVDDTQYRSAELTDAGWPSRWQEWSATGEPTWRHRADGQGFETIAAPQGPVWLRYRHMVPWAEDWDDLADGRIPRRLTDGHLQGQLITDYYAYNDSMEAYQYREAKPAGMHWVGDLAIHGEEVEIQGNQGAVLLDLVKGGVHYTCRIDVATGEAALSIDNGRGAFDGEDGTRVKHPKATTRLRGPGTYNLRFSNCDDQLLLWVNDRLVEFDGPTTYEPDGNEKPKWSPQDAGDLEPAGLGAEGVAVRIKNLQVLRDVYYVASSYQTQEDRRTPAEDDYENLRWTESRADYVARVFADPQSWATTTLFDTRRGNVQFVLGPDDFFPMGDNSPQSQDARVWTARFPQTAPLVKRDLLTGKALLIYWPHAWRRPIPFLPNFRRMGLIR
jgi:signal peptidase I